MELLPDTWYPIADLIERSEVFLGDGSTNYLCQGELEGGALQLLTGQARPFGEKGYHYLQVMLTGANRTRVHGLARQKSLDEQVIRDYLVCLPGCSFEYSLRVQLSGEVYSSPGKVCAILKLNSEKTNPDEGRRLREVESAAEKGLLDEAGKTRASNRLRNRSVIRQLGALQDSSYLPGSDWQLNVIFTQWYSEEQEGYVKSPLGEAPGTAILLGSLQFREEPGKRDFRIKDLF